jgi:hypothetical protein
MGFRLNLISIPVTFLPLSTWKCIHVLREWCGCWCLRVLWHTLAQLWEMCWTVPNITHGWKEQGMLFGLHSHTMCMISFSVCGGFESLCLFNCCSQCG